MPPLHLDETFREYYHGFCSPPMTDKENKDATSIEPETYKPTIVWKNIFLFIILHTGGFWGLWQIVTAQAMWQTVVWTLCLSYVSTLAVTVGTHRFFSHKCFKGNFWFKLLVIITQTLSGQNCIYIWSRDHRLHHKYSDTDADPHNSSRGFFFCHMGWLLLRKHPMVKLKGKNIDMSDLEAEPLVMFQKKYYYAMYMVIALGLPVAVPVYFWGESFKTSMLIAYFLRYMGTLHGTWTVNSIAHLWGYRPYSKDIAPVESHFVAFISQGEGWHNYHHTFPWDYRAAEFGQKWNFSATLIDWFASIGWAYDLKCATPQMVQHRINKRGDGSHKLLAPKIIEEAGDSEKNSSLPKNKDDTLKIDGTCFGDDDSEDIYGEKISAEGFTVLRRARA